MASNSLQCADVPLRNYSLSCSLDCKYFKYNSVTLWLLFFFCQDYESSAVCSVRTHCEVDEKLSHMRPVVVLETLNLAQYVTPP